jgi:transcriptional regulator with XRE-family HTH domain
MISIAQIKAARLFLGWEQAELAEKSGISLPTIQRIENPKFGPGRSRLEIVERLMSTLELGGVEFIRAEDGKGEGLRLRTPPSERISP